MKEYINKPAVVAEIEKLKGQLLRGACSSQISMETRCKEEAYNEVLSFLDTLEVKGANLDGYKEVSFELIPYSANIAVGGNEYFLQAKVTDKDLSQIGVSGFLYKLKLKVKA